MVLDLRLYRGDFETGDICIKDFKDYPLQHLHEWLIEAYQKGERFPNTMTLTTYGKSGITMRTVFLKTFKNEKLRFFSSYNGRKGLELESNDSVGVHFFFKKMRRQIFIRGTVKKIPISESEDYFNDKPKEYQLLVWASKDGQQILEEDELADHITKVENNFKNIPIPCPNFWGGYDVNPNYIEFWEGVEGILHQRLVYELIDGKWTKKKIAP